ncbi:hypothetical protein ACLB6C_20575 [Enterobacter hormaechei]
MANAIRTGHTNAFEEMMMQFLEVQEIASQQKKHRRGYGIMDGRKWREIKIC